MIPKSGNRFSAKIMRVQRDASYDIGYWAHQARPPVAAGRRIVSGATMAMAAANIFTVWNMWRTPGVDRGESSRDNQPDAFESQAD
jgi:hypothetical protein